MELTKLKLRIIAAGEKAVEELILVAEEPILEPIKKLSKDGDEIEVDLAADKLKIAAQAKKIAIFDAFEILSRIESEREEIKNIEKGASKVEGRQGFAERRSK